MSRTSTPMDRFKTSKLGSLFKRKKSPKPAPNDLYSSQSSSADVLVEVLDPVATDVKSFQACALQAVSSSPMESSKSLESSICCDVLQVKDVLTNEKGVDRLPETLQRATELLASGSLIANASDTSEKARNVHAEMLNAISQALARSRRSRLGEPIVSPSIEPQADCSAELLFDSVGLTDVLVPHHDLGSPALELPPTHKEAQTTLEKSSTRRRLKRRRTFHGELQVSVSNSEQRERTEYAAKQLPIIPALYLIPDYESRKKCRISPRQLRKALFFQNWSRESRIMRRRAYSNPDRPRPTTIHPASATSSASVNHLLGLVLFLHWLSAGRRFFDKQSEARLSEPGSRCLAIEHNIIGFQADFPLASLDIYRASNSTGSTTAGPRYTALPYPDDTFDVVSSLGLSVAIKTQDWPATLAELKRVLKPGGHLEFQAFSSAWINAGPNMIKEHTEYSTKLVKDGFCSEILNSLPLFVKDAGFNTIKLAPLAVPSGWGGRAPAVFSKYYEPLRAFREQQTSCVWTTEQKSKVEEEKITHRSSRGLLLIVAVK